MGSMTFSSAVSVGKSWKNWKTMPTLAPRQAASLSSFIWSMRSPAIVTLPAVGRSMPVIMLSIVDLPEPDGPTMATSWPSSMSRSTPLSASNSSLPVLYVFFRSRSWMSDMDEPPSAAVPLSCQHSGVRVGSASGSARSGRPGCGPRVRASRSPGMEPHGYHSAQEAEVVKPGHRPQSRYWSLTLAACRRGHPPTREEARPSRNGPAATCGAMRRPRRPQRPPTPRSAPPGCGPPPWCRTAPRPSGDCRTRRHGRSPTGVDAQAGAGWARPSTATRVGCAGS